MPTSENLKLEDINKLLEQKYGQCGIELFSEFALSSQKAIGLDHGGAPRSNYIAEYFLRCALGNPQSTEVLDYATFQKSWKNENNTTDKTVPVPSRKRLNPTIKIYIDYLENNLNKDLAT